MMVSVSLVLILDLHYLVVELLADFSSYDVLLFPQFQIEVNNSCLQLTDNGLQLLCGRRGCSADSTYHKWVHVCTRSSAYTVSGYTHLTHTTVHTVSEHTYAPHTQHSTHSE